MRYLSITIFRRAIKELTKKQKNGYNSIIKDISSDFQSKTIDEIRHNRDMVLEDTMYSIIKLRLPNSDLKLSKSDGFRLIYYVHKTKDIVVFIYVYPKRGPLGLITIKQQEILQYLEQLIEENDNKQLAEINITDLSVINNTSTI